MIVKMYFLVEIAYTTYTTLEKADKHWGFGGVGNFFLLTSAYTTYTNPV